MALPGEVGAADRSAIRSALKYLEAVATGVFLEGTRTLMEESQTPNSVQR